jgi:hypothetical protein
MFGVVPVEGVAFSPACAAATLDATDTGFSSSSSSSSSPAPLLEPAREMSDGRSERVIRQDDGIHREVRVSIVLTKAGSAGLGDLGGGAGGVVLAANAFATDATSNSMLLH